ncbi:MAG: glycosyltransferase family 4 protein [Chloroflexi bacterium]|nr:glycosyltransferase family 4 protein [Chloroflexota bacterium]
MLAVNARFQGLPITGLERYAREVTRRLRPSSTQLITPGSPLPGFRGQLWEQVVLPRRVHQSDVLWSPTNTGPLAVGRQVVTVHDAAIFDHPEWFHPKVVLWYRLLIPRLMARASIIITDSQFSKTRLLHHTRVSAEKIIVVPCGVDNRFQIARGTPHLFPQTVPHLPSRYVLAVGTLEPRKNLRRLLSAWEIVMRHTQDVVLLLSGQQSTVFSDSHIDKSAVGVRFIGHVDDRDLPLLYARAAAVAYPSLYEGFGLPVLEAMAAGVPVVSTTAPALREVAGDAALLVDPYNEEALADALLRVLEDSGLSGELVSRGIARAAQFTWEKTAEGVMEILEQA